MKADGRAKKELNRKGRAKLTAEVTFVPEYGEPNTQSVALKLVKK